MIDVGKAAEDDEAVVLLIFILEEAVYILVESVCPLISPSGGSSTLK